MITILNLERWYFSTNHKSFTGARGRDGPVGKKPNKGGVIGYGFSSDLPVYRGVSHVGGACGGAGDSFQENLEGFPCGK
ncbi:hypothetical protein L6452_01300 [Arctium lappa]|uniref:Uncharacterized protein n=1 Tax=Arctium lappa TaxID=4217 RepID=A0ACB9FH59_ARCLA|nr:hypothetical protein L6452_01300 [Arctium lappa]